METRTALIVIGVFVILCLLAMSLVLIVYIIDNPYKYPTTTTKQSLIDALIDSVTETTAAAE